MTAKFLIGKLLHEFFSRNKTPGFLACKHYRRQTIAFHQRITDSGFTVNRHARGFKAADVAVNRTQTHLKTVGEFLRFHDFFRLQLDYNGNNGSKTFWGFVEHERKKTRKEKNLSTISQCSCTKKARQK